MHELLNYICDELYDLEQKAEKDGKLSMAEIQYGDVLAHFKKNLLSAEEMMGDEDGASYRGSSYYGASRAGRGGRSNRGSYEGGRSNRSYEGGGRSNRSYEGGRSRNSYAYSRADYMDEMRRMMENAPDDQTRQSIQRMISQMEQQM